MGFAFSITKGRLGILSSSKGLFFLCDGDNVSSGNRDAKQFSNLTILLRRTLFEEAGLSEDYIARYLDTTKQLGFDKWMDTNELQALALQLGNSEMISGLSGLSLVQEGGTFSIRGNTLTFTNPDGSSSVLTRKENF